MINTLPIKKRDSRLPMIMKEIGGVTYTKPFLGSESNFNILPSGLVDYDDVGKL